MQFRFTPISNDVMAERLIYISKKENVTLSDDIYDVIMNVVNGDLRKGIMLLQNINYINNINSSITTTDVYDLVGHVPIEIIKNILLQCIKCTTLTKIIESAYDFQLSGYPLSIVCSQLCGEINKCRTIDDNKKSKIYMNIANICVRLNDGENETIQLLDVLTMIHSVLHSNK